VGPNGAGKSTLLKILAGVLPIQGGTREYGDNVRAGYFAQNRVENLNPKHTVFEEAMDARNQNIEVTEQLARTILGGLLFRKDDVFKRVSVLSGGEKSRLALAKLLLAPPNLLLMDEPTTHLDIPSIDALVAALKAYQGTLIFISHDVYFIRQLANQVLHVHAGRLTAYAGGYDYFLDKSRATNERGALTAGLRPNGENRPSAAPANAKCISPMLRPWEPGLRPSLPPPRSAPVPRPRNRSGPRPRRAPRDPSRSGRRARAWPRWKRKWANSSACRPSWPPRSKRPPPTRSPARPRP